MDIPHETSPIRHTPTTKPPGKDPRPQESPQHLAQEDLAHRANATSQNPDRRHSQETIRNWAQAHGKIVNPLRLDELPTVCHRTAEHLIKFDPATGQAVKILKPDQFGMTINPESGDITTATLADYVNRVRLAQAVFQDDIEIQGVVELPDFFEEKTTPCLVTRQTWYQGNEPSPEEISGLLREFGFRPLARNYAWTREADKITIADARPDNFIKTTEGIFPIDLLIHQQT